jgi:hypothetical protein
MATVESIAHEATEVLKLAEDIMSRHAAEFKEERIPEHTANLFTLEEQLVFKKLGWSTGKLHEQFGKRAAAARWSEKAGTKEEREQEKKQAAKDDAAFTKQSPGIERTIDEAQGKLAALKSARDNSQKVVDDRAFAITRCRLYVPAHITEQHNRAVKDLKRAGIEAGDARYDEADRLLDYYVR